ncbi:MAG: serine/threonine-protein kinase, partial [Acidimicrobiaceae bacterium]|nr:serine/threonine-protein kinase [Acidimicrobiaceae bacterium]
MARESQGAQLGVTVPEIAGYGEFVEIGRGGYSHVYRARQYEFDRPVAVKVLNEPLKDSKAVDAFERECRTMGALWDHPNIVPVFASAFTSDDRPCIVMKLFHEGSYSQVLINSGPIELEELLVVGVKIAGALAAAHEARVVHGDVKPHNIFKSRFGEPALGDFGIATFAGHSKDAAPLGVSVHYAAPEVVDSDLGPSSDQYSLAATLYTLALGRRPFEASDPTESNSSTDVLHRAITRPIPQLPKRFPKEFRDIIWRAMSRDPGERYDEMSAFSTALSEVAAGLDAPPRRAAARPGDTETHRRRLEARPDAPLSAPQRRRRGTGAARPGKGDKASREGKATDETRQSTVERSAGPSESAGRGGGGGRPGGGCPPRGRVGRAAGARGGRGGSAPAPPPPPHAA